jgi:hypothetical protein
MRTQFFTGIVGLSLVLLLVIGPLYVADRLEGIETARVDLKSFSELVTSSSVEWDNETIESYQPYIEMNSSTVFTREGINFGRDYNNRASCFGYWSYNTAMTNHIDANFPTWNVDGFKDYYDMPSLTDNAQQQGLFLKVPSFSDLISDNANQFYLYWDCPVELYVKELRAIGGSATSGDVNTNYAMTTTLNKITDRTTFAYEKEILIEFEASDLNSASSNCDGQAIKEIFVLFEMNIATTNGVDPWIFDFQISPEYYEVSENIPHNMTVWDNHTVTYYEPYIQGISNPHTWTVWSLGFGGFFLIVVALFSTPIINLSGVGKK